MALSWTRDFCTEGLDSAEIWHLSLALSLWTASSGRFATNTNALPGFPRRAFMIPRVTSDFRRSRSGHGCHRTHGDRHPGPHGVGPRSQSVPDR